MSKTIVLILAVFSVACGRGTAKKLPDPDANVNNAPNNTNNATVGTNNETNNGTTIPLNNMTTPQNNTIVPTNNGTANNTANNQTVNNTVPPLPAIAYISGQAGELDGELDAHYAFSHVGGDEEPLLGDLRDFWLDGDADNYGIVIVEWGFHFTNLSENYPDANAVMDAAYQWVEQGGTLLDLSGGFAYNAFPGFYEIDLALVQPGSYTAFAQDSSLPYTEFAWTKADNGRNMAAIAPASIKPVEGESVLVDSFVTTCEALDFECANPTFDRHTAMFIAKSVGQGVVFHGNWVSPLDDEVVDTVLSVLPAP